MNTITIFLSSAIELINEVIQNGRKKTSSKTKKEKANEFCNELKREETLRKLSSQNDDGGVYLELKCLLQKLATDHFKIVLSRPDAIKGKLFKQQNEGTFGQHIAIADNVLDLLYYHMEKYNLLDIPDEKESLNLLIKFYIKEFYFLLIQTVTAHVFQKAREDTRFIENQKDVLFSKIIDCVQKIQGLDKKNHNYLSYIQQEVLDCIGLTIKTNAELWAKYKPIRDTLPANLAKYKKIIMENKSSHSPLYLDKIYQENTFSKESLDKQTTESSSVSAEDLSQNEKSQEIESENGTSKRKRQYSETIFSVKALAFLRDMVQIAQDHAPEPAVGDLAEDFCQYTLQKKNFEHVTEDMQLYLLLKKRLCKLDMDKLARLKDNTDLTEEETKDIDNFGLYIAAANVFLDIFYFKLKEKNCLDNLERNANPINLLNIAATYYEASKAFDFALSRVKKMDRVNPTLTQEKQDIMWKSIEGCKNIWKIIGERKEGDESSDSSNREYLISKIQSVISTVDDIMKKNIEVCNKHKFRFFVSLFEASFFSLRAPTSTSRGARIGELNKCMQKTLEKLNTLLLHLQQNKITIVQEKHSLSCQI